MTETTAPTIDLAAETALSGADLALVIAVTALALAILFRRRIFGRNRTTAPACAGCGGCTGTSCASAIPAPAKAKRKQGQAAP